MNKADNIELYSSPSLSPPPTSFPSVSLKELPKVDLFSLPRYQIKKKNAVSENRSDSDCGVRTRGKITQRPYLFTSLPSVRVTEDLTTSAC